MIAPPQEHAEGLPEERGDSGAGARLRAAREARKLSRVDVARQLHLDAKLVAALENQDMASLPPSIFVRGYVRSYARLLDLPEAELVVGFETQRDEPGLLPNIDLKPQASSHDVPVRLMTYTLIVGLMTLALLWWFGKGSQPTRQLLGLEGTLPVNGIPAATAPDMRPAPKAPVSPASPLMPVAGLAPARTVARAPQKVRRTSVVGRAVQGATGIPAAGGMGVVVRRGVVPVGGVRPFVLYYSQPSWTAISDADGRELVYQLVAAGTTLKLGGPAPFSVLLGYSPGVHIEYNGRPFDVARYSRNNVAHFVIGKASASAVPTPVIRAPIPAPNG